ncbi:MAG: hypothetical protein ABI444_06805, partial [Candidatus Kapaibacterium sp.]
MIKVTGLTEVNTSTVSCESVIACANNEDTKNPKIPHTSTTKIAPFFIYGSAQLNTKTNEVAALAL